MSEASALRVEEEIPEISAGDSHQVAKKYAYWRRRILFSMIFGYAAFYFVRQNFAISIPALEAELGYSKAQLGWISSVFAIIYGVSKGGVGVFADRFNARFFMTLGLGLSALTSVLFGLSSGFWTFMLLWGLNALFQSMGAPPCQRLLTHWFSPREIATKWALWNSSHQIGAAAITLIGGYLVVHFGWQSTFIIPGIVTVGAAIALFVALRDTPESMGLPSIEKYAEGELHEPPAPVEPPLSVREILGLVWTNKLVWYMSMANMFFYVLRFGLLTWAPTFLVEHKGCTLVKAAWQTVGYDLAGIVGGIFAGWISDKIFHGRRGPVGAALMLGLMVLLIALSFLPYGATNLSALFMFLIGLFISGPQILQGVAAADFASKRAAATANGMTGVFGYIGGAFSGVGIGEVADHFGWEAAFGVFAFSALAGSIFFALTWNEKAHSLK